MAAKIIMVSFSEGDKQFCADKNLSPSKLLQERITQIRDNAEFDFKKALAEQQQSNNNLQRKIEFLASRQQKIYDLLPEDIAYKYLKDV